MTISFRTFPLAMITLAACAGLGTAGCFIATDTDGGAVVVGDGTTVVDTVANVSIDTDQAMTTTPGQGAGVYVEYASGGHWNIYTSCDTLSSGTACNFDIILTTNSSVVSNVQGAALEPADVLTVATDGTIHFSTATTNGLDGVTFDTDPGAVVELDMTLDGVAQPSFVSWVSRGVAQLGAPSNPVDFHPTAP